MSGPVPWLDRFVKWFFNSSPSALLDDEPGAVHGVRRAHAGSPYRPSAASRRSTTLGGGVVFRGERYEGPVMTRLETNRRPRLSQREWSVIAIGACIALALLYGFYVAVAAAVDRGQARRQETRLAAERTTSCVGEAVARCARADAYADDALSLHTPVPVPKRLIRNVVMSASAR